MAFLDQATDVRAIPRAYFTYEQSGQPAKMPFFGNHLDRLHGLGRCDSRCALIFPLTIMAYLYESWQFWTRSSMYDMAAWSSHIVGEVAALIVYYLRSVKVCESQFLQND